MSDAIIQTDRLTRYFGHKCAVDQVSLSVPRGSVFALLGRNGSGKSTIIRMLMGLLEPTRGMGNVLGDDCTNLSPAVRGRVAYVAEGHPLIDWMRVRDLEAFQKPFYRSWNARTFKAVIDHFELDSSAKAGHLSRGQRAGVSLALAIATEPEVLVMDDPALGLDPVARRTLLEAMILLTRDSGRTIFFTSHVLDDVERVADHVAILDQSILRVSAPVEKLRQRIKQIVLSFADTPPKLPNVPGLLQARREAREMRLVVANYGASTQQLLETISPIQIETSEISLEDIVVAYLGARGEKLSLLQTTQAPPAMEVSK
jgi:ABC-2 type transport system ATP-binding protein